MQYIKCTYSVNPHHSCCSITNNTSAPPALLAATIAAIYPICTLFLNTTRAIVPPIRAAAILSRNEERIKTKIRRRNGPFQSSGRNLGKISGTPDSSNIFDKNCKSQQQPEKIENNTPFPLTQVPYP